MAEGAALALGVHAAVLAAAVLLGARPAPPAVQADVPTMKVFAPSRIVEFGAAVAGGVTSIKRPSSERPTMRAATAEHRPSKRRTTEAPSPAPAMGDAEPSTGTSAAAAESGAGTREGGSRTGAGAGATGGAPVIALPFGEGMQRPTLVEHRAPVYSREASAARDEGPVIAQCVITVEGSLRNCRIVKGVSHMDAAVLEALSHWRYTPVTFQGRAVSVEYTIMLRLVAP
jgi:protein TonB